MSTYGVRAAARLVPLTAGVAAEVAPANPGRRYIMVQNIGSADATLGLDATPTAGAGWLLAAGGGALGGEADVVLTNQLQAIAAATTTLVVWEG